MKAVQVSLHLSTEGKWVCETEPGGSRLKSGDLIRTHEKIWRLVDAEKSVDYQDVEETVPVPHPAIDLYFNVSQNEEHVSLKLKTGERSIDLEERSHHYLLLLLARKRLEDNTKAMRNGEQGWIDKKIFSDMLGLSDSHINILIYRFRKQCYVALPDVMLSHKIIERRVGELRLNCREIHIEGGLLDYNPVISDSVG